jgi:condensation domain-containing protein
MQSESKSIRRLSPLRRRVLQLMLQKKGIQPRTSTAIQPRQGNGPSPLSYAQERIWFFEQLEPGTPAYNIPAAVRLTGPLNVEALRQSLTEIMRRHEALRTAFHSVEGSPFQIAGPAGSLPLPTIDMRGASAEIEAGASHPSQQTLEMIRREINRPFDLSVGPLLRCCLWRVGEDEHIALLTTHHIASDGWSIHLLFGELAILHDAFSCGKPSPLRELPVQYADFAQWQRERLQGEALDEQLTFWRRQLDQAPSTLNLPGDHPRPARRTFRGARHFIVIPPELTGSLNELSKQEGVTLFMLTLAAFKTLLYRCSWQEDIVVGSPIANRNRSETENLIGFFVNTLILRTNLSGNPGFRELLGRVRETTLGAYAHQDMPFDQLVDALQSKRDIGQHPLFQVFFALNNNPTPDFNLERVSLGPLSIDNGVAKFDVEISLIERDNGLVVNAIYNPDLFDSSTIELMLNRYATLLGEVAANPAARLLDVQVGEDGPVQPESAEPFLNSDQFAFE